MYLFLLAISSPLTDSHWLQRKAAHEVFVEVQEATRIYVSDPIKGRDRFVTAYEKFHRVRDLVLEAALRNDADPLANWTVFIYSMAEDYAISRVKDEWPSFWSADTHGFRQVMQTAPQAVRMDPDVEALTFLLQPRATP